MLCVCVRKETTLFLFRVGVLEFGNKETTLFLFRSQSTDPPHRQQTHAETTVVSFGSRAQLELVWNSLMHMRSARWELPERDRGSARFWKRLPSPEAKILKTRIRHARARIKAKEFRRLCEQHTHCPSCGVDMKVDASHIDWEEVRGYPSDPCDDCCCGACGSRKSYPGQCHC